MAAKKPSRALLFLTVLAAPVALGFETGVRKAFFPPEFAEVREILNPLLTPLAWGFVGVASIASVVGLFVQRRMAAKRVARARDRAEYDARYREVFAVFLITTAVPQLPAIFSTFMFTFGSSLLPVAIAIGISSLGVVGQAMRIPSLAEELR